MTTRFTPTDRLEAATQMVRDYLLAALDQRFLQIPTEYILAVAESIWNNHEPGVGPPSFEESFSDDDSHDVGPLITELHRLRTNRFGAATFFIFALDFDYVGADVLFTCDLMWEDSAEVHPLELRVNREHLAPPERN